MSEIKLSDNFIKNTVKLALNEDLFPSGDITSDLIKNDKKIEIKLISNQYINEERFAISFCQGKFRIKKWGKNKIKNELKKRDISKNCIIKGLDSIDEDQYQEILKKIIEQKIILLLSPQ